MHKTLPLRLTGIVFFIHSSFCFAQWAISKQDSTYTIDFTGFNGSGFAPDPSAGQLGSDRWSVTGMSDGTLNFIGTQTTVSTDFTRGGSTGGVTTGGVYAFNTGSGNIILGVQPLGVDFTPGNIILRILNNTGAAITSFVFKYDIFFLNDQGRSSSLNFSYSTDSTVYTALSAENYTTTASSDITPAWGQSKHSIYITGVNIQPSARFYFKWTGDDVGGAGNRDEYGIDNIAFTANPSLIKSNFQNTNVCLGDSVRFYDQSSSLIDTVVSWDWDLGDTFTDTLANPAHLYAAAGSYTVQLIVKDSNHNTDTIQKIIVVNLFPVAGFTVSINDTIAVFTDLSSGNNLSYSWNFGDGNTAASANPTHIYVSSGTYTVCLAITNDAACTDTSCSIITVVTSLGINNFSKKFFISVFPNPSNGLVSFDYSSEYNNSTTTLVVTSSIGSTMLEKIFLNDTLKSIDLSAFPKGLYYITFSTESNREVKRILLR